MYNFYYQHQDFVVMAIPRCGSESIAYGLNLPYREAVTFPRIVAFIRDPLERLRSGFQFFHPFPFEYRHAPTWESWVDRVLDQPLGDEYQRQLRGPNGRLLVYPKAIVSDPHWLPQATIINEAPIQPTEVWRFERLTDVLPGLPHKHQSRPVAVNTSYRITELRAYYAGDTALRLTARDV